MEKHSDKQPENNEESLLLQQPQQQQLQILQQLQQLNENLLRQQPQQQLQGQEAVEIQQQGNEKQPFLQTVQIRNRPRN
jgi:hypothetical protein